ncbi:MAG: RNA 2',3'-cyclic phosphodiesterase [Thermoplasmata archaeon]
MRAFVAVRAPPIDGLAPLLLSPGSGRHLTLRFLGEIQEGQVGILGSALDQALASFPPFDLQLGGIGAFPSAQHPRVVWAGVTLGSSETVALAQQVESTLAPLGIPGEARPFVPHVTLFRIRTPTDRRRAETLLTSAAEVNSPTLRVTYVLLQKSTLTRNGAIHETLHRSPLGASDASSGSDPKND